MSLQAQIEVMSVPQEFSRLCNAVLRAEHGDDFLPIDDDRSDRGNDGYLKSERRMFACHCFKRIQNQGLDQEIKRKMAVDLKKAVLLKDSGDWSIDAWTFISNYPVSESIGQEVVSQGLIHGIDVSWRGADYLAEVLQKYRHVRELFPNLLTIDILTQLESIMQVLDASDSANPQQSINWAPRNVEEQHELLTDRPPLWEYLLFAGTLWQGKARLEMKWRDYQVGYATRRRRYLTDREAIGYLNNSFYDALAIPDGLMTVLTPESQEAAFGPPGEPGDPIAIEHLSRRIVGGYEELLEWADDVRGTRVSDRMSPVFSAAANMMYRPAQGIRDFIDSAVTQINDLPSRIQEEPTEPIEVVLPLVLDIDDDVQAKYDAEFDRAQAALLAELDTE